MHHDRQKMTTTALEARRAEVARLYCCGTTQPEIGRRLGIHQGTVSRDLAAIRDEWRRVMAEEFDRLKAEQLARIDAAEAAAWQGWERSLRDAERTLTRKVTDPDGDRIEASRVVEGQAGDPRFLQIVLDCVDKRLRLIGGYPKDDAPRGTAEVVIIRLGPGLTMADLHSDPPVIRAERRELPPGS